MSGELFVLVLFLGTIGLLVGSMQLEGWMSRRGEIPPPGAGRGGRQRR